MNKYDKKRKYCKGCTENFYNDNNPHGIKECWHLTKSMVVWKKIVGLWQTPPWKQKASRVLDCQHIKGSVMIDPKRTY